MMRYLPTRPFPPYAFIPGHNPHPEKEGGHMFEIEHKSYPLKIQNVHHHEDYLYAFDLFNGGYYWESHVWWEELWHLAGRKGELADFLKALIKVAAAALKLKLDQGELTQGHLERAIELISPLANHHLESFYAVNLKKLESDLKQLLISPQKILHYQIQLEDIENIL